MDAEVAVKVLADNWAHDDSVRRRFLEEGRFLRRVESEHVVQVHDVGEMEDGRPFLVLTYADRGTLADRLKQEPLSLEAAVGVIVQVGRGLQALHRRGLLHRDVKPANVLFRSTDEGERAVLSDLGLGKSLDEVSRITMPGGTPSYVAPEQAMGERLDQRADQYSLGAVAYAALTGRSPHQLDGLGAAGRVQAPPPPSSLGFAVPDKVDEAIVRALDPDREKRWPDVVSFTRELVGALDETTHGFTAAGLNLKNATEPAIKPAVGAAATDPVTKGPDVEAGPDESATASKAANAGAEAGSSTLDAEPPTETVDPAGEKTAFSESNAPTVVKTPAPSAEPAEPIAVAALAATAPSKASSGAASSTTASSAPASAAATSHPEASGASTAAADEDGFVWEIQPRRRRGRWVVAALLALIIGGGAGFGAQRYLEPRLLADVSRGGFSLRVPSTWAETIVQSSWRPPGDPAERPAIRVSKDNNWDTPGMDTPGIFVGVMARNDPRKLLPSGEQYGCTDNPDIQEGDRNGQRMVERISSNCSNGSTLLQRVVDTGENESLLIQVQMPGSERSRAQEVADSVTFSAAGSP